MPIIKPLPPEVAAQIAAGEVVERPSSAVKELVENAIDAGARAITVEIEDGGRKRIAVTDDGCGMDATDARLALMRYATSKIAAEDDLWRLTTMGFRGEALHAIASVSTVTIETRTRDALEGTRVEARGGSSPSVTAAGCPKGTRVEVRDLFFNTPARQKFLKSPSVEFGHISSEVARMALAHPHIAFELAHNGRRTWIHPAAREPRDRLRIIASAEELDSLLELDESGYGLRVTGWIGGERMMRASPKDFHVYVNRRPVRDRLLMHGISAGYGPALDRGTFPVAAVFVEMDPCTVDVNVHPAKREVRFENGPAVHDFLQAAVRKALGSARSERAFGGAVVQRKAHCHSERPSTQGVGCSGVEESLAFENPTERDPSASPQNDRQANAWKDHGLRVLGQFDRAFILAEDRDGALVVVDQHAAHERLGFAELMRQHEAGRVERQHLLFPQTMSFAPAEMAQFDAAAHALAQAGFEVEHFGGDALAVKAVPAMLGDVDVRSLFERIFEEMKEIGSSAALGEKIEHIFAVVACHRQIRAGDELKADEMQRLVNDVIRERIDSCPHGRPAIVRFKRNEIDKWFKR